MNCPLCENSKINRDDIQVKINNMLMQNNDMYVWLVNQSDEYQQLVKEKENDNNISREHTKNLGVIEDERNISNQKLIELDKKYYNLLDSNKEEVNKAKDLEDKVSYLTARNKEIQEELDDFIKERKAYESRKYDLKSDIRKLKAKNDDLEFKNSDLRRDLELKSKDKKDFELKYNESNKQLDEIKKLKLTNSDLNDELILEINKLTNDITILESKIKSEIKNNSKLQEVNKSLLKDKDKLEEEIANNKNSVNNIFNVNGGKDKYFTDKLKDCDVTIAKLKNKLKNYIRDKNISSPVIEQQDISSFISKSNNDNDNDNNKYDILSDKQVAIRLLNLFSKFKIKDNIKDLREFFKKLYNNHPDCLDFKFYYAASIDKEELLQDKAEKYYVDLIFNSDLENKNKELYIWTAYNLGYLYYSRNKVKPARHYLTYIHDNYFNQGNYGKFANKLIESTNKLLDDLNKEKPWIEVKNNFIGKKTERTKFSK